MTWRETKDAGKQAFSEGNHSQALSLYTEAIDQLLSEEHEGSDEIRGNGSRSGGGDHTSEHQILLSNVVACRLKIGGNEMVTKAVDDAKKCVALNNKWPKAHVRLASAYIALGGHSNDACVSLQRALSLDRNNTVAREMLVKEMRQRNNRERTGSINEVNRDERNGSQSSSSSYPTEETPGHAGASAPPHSSDSTNSRNYDGIDVDDIDPPDAYYSLSFSERIQHHFAQLITWFHSQSEDIQTLIKVACFFVVLYVALGGRFGLDYALGGNKSIGRRGNYEGGSAYDKYSSSSAHNRYSTNSDRYQDPYGNDGYATNGQRQHQTGNAYNTGDANNRYSTSSDRHQGGYGYNEGSSTHRKQQQAGNTYNSGSGNDRYASSSGRYQDQYGYNEGSSSHRRQQAESTHSTYDTHGRANSGYNDRTSSQNDRHYPRYEDEQYYQPRGRRRNTSYHMPNLFDGSMVSMGILFIIGIVCQRFGVNPFHVMGMLNVMQGRGRRWGYGAYQGRGLGGMGGMGGGFGFGRGYGFGRRGGFPPRGRAGYY
mmetsp:Transcript_41467/g.71004  ORF Transcript_41467/g.71004 Transcript_41467/m.71004 type:complete len:540 (+) Transcript_41467:86-1705(+)